MGKLQIPQTRPYIPEVLESQDMRLSLILLGLTSTHQEDPR